MTQLRSNPLNALRPKTFLEKLFVFQTKLYTKWFLVIFTGLILAACVSRYLQFPSFWLDEAWVSVSLRNPSLPQIYGRLEHGMFFPRLYLTVIAVVRELLGYQIWSLRLLPTLCFALSTILWLKLLAKRSGSYLLLILLGGFLLIGSSYWLEQAIQLKQYTFDVLLSLLPFLVDDTFFKKVFGDGKNKIWLICLAIPWALSYTYPFALCARVSGWYLQNSRLAGWRIRISSIALFVAFITVGLLGIWLTDHRFNMADQQAYFTYWQHCSLRSLLFVSPLSALRLIADFLWGWHHGRLMPFVVAVIAPLQALGVYWIIQRWKHPQNNAESSDWGSRSLGSLILLGGVIAASGILNYPICSGRLVLFAQVHTQILALEGALFLLTFGHKYKAAQIFLYAGIAIVMFYSSHRYLKFLQEESPENLRPLLPLINAEEANIVWVHPCSIAQVESLPEPLPVQKVMLKTKKELPEANQKVWILWTNLSNEDCIRRLAEVQSYAKRWQIVHQSQGRGLVLAEF